MFHHVTFVTTCHFFVKGKGVGGRKSRERIGPILDDRLKNPETPKDALSSHSVCLFVRLSVDGLQGTPFGLGT